MKKLLALLLVVVMLVSVVSCGNKKYTDPYEGLEYDEVSRKIYDEVLGDFYTAYQAALQETNVSKRQALMAIAEAKLLESGVMLPLSSNGGMYAISKIAPYTNTSVLWGNDSYRYHDRIVCTTPIKSEHRTEMKAKWGELQGTGTYEAWAKAYLVEKGYTIKDTYDMGYSTDPQTWDALATSQSADSEAILNTYDGLMEYDMENVLQPALATGYTVSDDGLTYTFTLRQGVKWVDYQGQEFAEVTADDFVAGMQHMCDAAEGLEYLIQGVIVNASEYIDGTVTDFKQVGVKAVDKYTLQYTLVAPTSYFITMLGYGVFAPMSRDYYASQGGKFGADYDSAAEDYNYGKTPNNIAYCGPYIVTNNTEENKIVFSANESYWDAANINLKTITWWYNDGEDAMKAYNDLKAGTLDGCSLNASSLVQARTDKVEGTDKTWFEAYYYVSSTDATSFMAFYNLNRTAYANFNDPSKVVTTLTETEQLYTNAAMRNVHFRRALNYAVDRGAYNAQVSGEELKLTSLRNCYVPGTFVSLVEEVTVSINGADKTYPAGTKYGQILQDQLTADGLKVKVWDPTLDDGQGSSDGFDGWYNPTEAAAELELAIAELKDAGIKVDAENPIKLELPYFSGSSSYAARAQAYKQSVEAALGGKVQIVLAECTGAKDWYYAGYYTQTGDQANYNIYDVSGWGPDYGDPQSYLDTFLPDYAGYMCKSLGIY